MRGPQANKPAPARPDNRRRGPGYQAALEGRRTPQASGAMPGLGIERNAAGPTAGSRCGTRLVQLHTKGAPMSRVLARVGAERVCSCPGFPKNNDQPADLDFSVRTVSRHEEGGGVGDKSPTPE